MIPQVFRQRLLKELRVNHLGMSRMNALARSYLWWPNLDSDIKQMARNCDQCKLAAPNPPASPAHPWLVPHNVLERIHVRRSCPVAKVAFVCCCCRCIVKVARSFCS